MLKLAEPRLHIEGPNGLPPGRRRCPRACCGGTYLFDNYEDEWVCLLCGRQPPESWLKLLTLAGPDLLNRGVSGDEQARHDAVASPDLQVIVR